MDITSQNMRYHLNAGNAKYIDENEMYMVTRDGDIYSLYNRNRGEPRKLKPIISKDGYCRVRLYIDGKVKRLLIHRAVADAFIPNPEEYLTVNHKDENPYNNSVDNLEWCTQKYNNNYGNRKKKISKEKSKKVAQIGLDGSIVKIWNSTGATKIQGFNQGSVSACARGKLSKHKGYKWKYVE
jgi:hypothetical protein